MTDPARLQPCHLRFWCRVALCLTMLAPLLAQDPVAAGARQVLDISPGWRFVVGQHQRAEFPDYPDAGWQVVDLPHTWNALDGQDGGNNYRREIAWYRKRVDVPLGWAGKRIFVTFNGANTVADAFINGVPLGRHVGGYAAFTYDITEHVRPGAENVIAALVSNVPDRNIAPIFADFTFCGGLYRSVVLTATGTAHVSLTDFSSPGVYLRQQHVAKDRAEVQIRTLVRNDAAQAVAAALEIDIGDAEGASVAHVKRKLALGSFAEASDVEAVTIAQPRLWDGRRQPHLYTVAVRIVVDGVATDEVRQALGLRSFAMDPNLGFVLNGVPYDLHGASLHQGRWNKGFAIADADVDQDVGLLEEIGATFVRLAHYQHPQRTYQRCDQTGIVAWAELPCVLQVNPDARFTASCEHQLTELIRQNYNHPAICCWGLFNEIPTGKPELDLIARLVALAHAEDPDRPTTGASYQTGVAPLNHLTDVIAFNEYYGWFIPNYDLMSIWADRFHAVYPARPFGLSEYGVGASIRRHVEHPVQPTLSVFSIRNGPHSEEYMSMFHEAVWPQLAQRRFLWCKSLWTLCDFPSDAQATGDVSGICDMGLVTVDRAVKKDAFFYYKAQWSAEPFLYLAERRFTTRPRAQADITIYTNLAAVSATLNGAPLPPIVPQGGVARWRDIALQSGKNVVVASGSRAGGALLTDSVTWTAP